jgi:DNA-directed RNA polymerase specialized sigma24 family protein
VFFTVPPDDVQSDGAVLLPSSQDESGKRKWRLSQQAFDHLLASLSKDREEAGQLYQRLHRKLVRYFEWRGINRSEERADETMNRVARRLQEGQQITRLNNYVYGVARHVFDEALREPVPEPLDEVPPKLFETVVTPLHEDDPRLKCFDRCLEELTVESRHLILGYYQEERRAKIQLRQTLANSLRIPLNALRIRAHRIRVSLEECIKNCLETETV